MKSESNADLRSNAVENKRRYPSRGEAARYLGVSVRTLDTYPIRRITLGHRTVKYDLHDLDAYMESRKEG